ncbi:NUDIX hydrolase [Nonomuraea indica]|uniref:NUDIX hydrolase n=1 Tax=Nonomuraea indica TaxID=1581193 RepID=UPI001FEAD71D|nr:NUDIX domain-containing protein [Nonomuraea indica]
MTHDGEASGSLRGVLAEVAAERAAQDAMWGFQDFPDGTGRTALVGAGGVREAGEAAGRAKREVTEAAARGALTWRHVLHEEVLEAFAEDDPAALRAELIQVAAVAVKWVQALDRRREPPPRRVRQRFRAIVDVHVLLLRPARDGGPTWDGGRTGNGGRTRDGGPTWDGGRTGNGGPTRDGGPTWEDGPVRDDEFMPDGRLMRGGGSVGDGGLAPGGPGGRARTGAPPTGAPPTGAPPTGAPPTGARVREVLLGRRAGTGYGDGLWHLPSGHLEAGESVIEAAVREAREETGVVLDPADLTFVHVMHRAPERVGLFFAATRWRGEPYNAEPHKCSELGWWPLDKLPHDMVGYPDAALAHIRDGVPFALHEWHPVG